MKPATQVLIERYQKHLYAIAFNICRNQQDAEDVRSGYIYSVSHI